MAIKRVLITFGVLLCTQSIAMGTANKLPDSLWQKDEQLLTKDGIAALESAIEKMNTSSLLILRRGKIAYQYGDIYKKHLIHSIRKPLLSLLYGIAINEGVFDLSDNLKSLNVTEQGVNLTSTEKTATLADLLTARSGVYLPAAAETQRMQSLRPERGSHKPGDAYYYNNWSFNALGTVFENGTGVSIYEYFHQKLAKPLGLQGYKNKVIDLSSPSINDAANELKGLDGFYSFERDKSRHPAYHFRLSSNDMAMIGQMLVNNGRWQDTQIVPNDWIEKSTQCYSILNDNIGGSRRLCYGMMWEVIQSNETTISFSHTGLGAHLLYVYPKAELVIIHRVDSEAADYVSPKAGVHSLIGITLGALKR